MSLLRPSRPVSPRLPRRLHLLAALAVTALGTPGLLAAQTELPTQTELVAQTDVAAAPLPSTGPIYIQIPLSSAIRQSFDGDVAIIARYVPLEVPANAAVDASGYSTSAPVFGPQQSGAQQPGTTAPASAQNASDQPSKRILGIVPNYRAVGVGAKLPPQSVKEKFVTASQDTFDYSAFALALIVAGYSDATNATPEFKGSGGGGATFGRYLWHSFLDQTTENYSVEFIVPALTHEDTRYYTLGTGGFKKRAGYALSRLVITRSDSGHQTVNLSELVGAGISAGASNFYYPRPERTTGQTLSKYFTDLGIDAASYFIREFDTEITRILTPKHK